MTAGEMVLAVLLLVLAAGYFAVYLWATRTPKPPARLAPLALTPLAALVMAAHKAVEHHDLAVLTGTAEEVENSLVNVISTSNELAGHLYQKERTRTEKKQ